MERANTGPRRLGEYLRRAADLRSGQLAPRLIVLSLVAAIVPLAAAVVIGGRAATTVVQEQATANLQNYAGAVAGQLDAALANRLTDVKVLAADPAVVRFLSLPPDQRDAVQGPTQAAVQRFVGSDPAYTFGFLLSDKGIVQFSTNDALYRNPDLSFRAYFQEAIAGTANVSEISRGVNVPDPAVFFTAPVRNEAGAILGTASLRLKAEALWSSLEDRRLGPGETSLVVN
jgi:C4-dicarboxylate-specific signal transduction histidine kinase